MTRKKEACGWCGGIGIVPSCPKCGRRRRIGVRRQRKATTKPWPTFVPLDIQVTCRRCDEPWDVHGIDSAHCPPCSKRLKSTKSQAWIEGYCNKVHGHKGKCADVVDTTTPTRLDLEKDKYGRRWPVFDKRELCPVCGQPDSCGDCNHKRLPRKEVLQLGGKP
jgi:hypothetical protein